MTEVICNSGLETIAKAVNGVAGMTAYTYMALGTSTTAPTASDTGLGAETSATGLERALATTSYEASNKAKWDHTWLNSSGGTVGINEWGIHNQATATSGDILAHGVFASTKNVEDGESIQITVTITFS